MRTTRRALSRYIGVSMVLPGLVTAVGTLLQWSWTAELPSPVANHWSGSGPDGFGPAWQTIAATIGFGWVLPVLLSTLLIPAITRQRASTATVRFMAGTCLWTSLFLAGLLTSTLWIQRGLSDASHAPGIGGWLAASMAIATVASTACAFSVPTLTDEHG